MAQNKKLGKTATSVYRDSNGSMVVKYHRTEVVIFDDKRIILNTGGWFTATTKSRMNQAANQFNLGYTVIQKAGVWSVFFRGYENKFTGDSICLNREALDHEADPADDVLVHCDGLEA